MNPCNLWHGISQNEIALQKWFLAICLIGNAKKSLSSHQLARNLDLNQKPAWYIITCIRAEMAKKGGALLQGIIEADEAYIGGKPRNRISAKTLNYLSVDVERKRMRLLVLSSGARLLRNSHPN